MERDAGFPSKKMPEPRSGEMNGRGQTFDVSGRRLVRERNDRCNASIHCHPPWLAATGRPRPERSQQMDDTP
jgi:hypothetical protein